MIDEVHKLFIICSKLVQSEQELSFTLFYIYPAVRMKLLETSNPYNMIKVQLQNTHTSQVNIVKILVYQVNGVETL